MKACLALAMVALVVLACGAQEKTPQAVANEAPPQVANLVQPPYPEAARKAGVEGTSIVEVTIGADGAMVRCSLAASSGNSQLDEAALQAVHVSKFAAGTRDGKPVEMKVKIPFRFKLDGDSKGKHTQAPGGWLWTGWPEPRLCRGSSGPAPTQGVC
jgi:TonB family protein